MIQPIVVLNFAHPLTAEQRLAVEQLAGAPVDRIIETEARFDHTQPFAPQAQKLVESMGVDPHEWQSLRILVNLPSMGVIAGLVLAEMHGRMGYFPSVLRLRPLAGTTPPQFEVAEILDLYQVRERARAKR